MCSSVLAAVLMAAAILSCGGCTHAHRDIFRWDPFNHHHQLPIDAMIDVVNELAVDVLQDYAFSRGNFAFSPYGATSVLIALYEGSRGESARQIHDALRLPWNHDVIRIGFRDLHRRLRAYFVHEGFLSGLTFNKNTTEFRPEYIRALRFYGYEVEPAISVDMPSSTTQGPNVTTITASPDNSTAGLEMFNTDPPSTSDSGQASKGEGTTREYPKSTTAIENTTENIPENVTPETTAAVNESVMESTSEILYASTTTKISELTSPFSQTTAVEMTSVTQILENTETTPYNEMTTEIQRTTTLSSVSTTEKQLFNTEGTTEDVENSSETGTPHENSQATGATSEIDEKSTESGNTETTLTKVTSEPTITSTLSSTESPSSTIKDVENVNEQASTIYVVETGKTTENLEIVETTTPRKYPSTSVDATVEETSSTYPTGSVTPTSQFTTVTTDDFISDSSDLTSSTEQTSTSEILIGNTFTTSEKGVTSENTPLLGSTSTEDSKTTISHDDGGSTSTENSKTTISHDGGGSTSTEDSKTTISHDGEISITDPSTESFSTTSLAYEKTETLTNFVSSGETSTYSSEETTTHSSTNAPDTGERIARNILTAGTDTWLLNFIRETPSTPFGAPMGRIVKRSLIDGSHVFSLKLQNGMLDAGLSRSLQRQAPQLRLPFLVDGVLQEKVSVVTYNAIMPFAFVPRLDALALELPLENEWHRLVILLPLERRGLQELIYDLGSYPLGKVLRSLHPTRVSAIIPNILVEGFVVLTPTLQKLGIWDVFDPRRADLSCMSSDPDLYVRDLEQTITVDISSNSKLPELHAKVKVGRHRTERFTATHPFLYFVVDRDTKVPLIAGKMVDPLNSRIH